MELTERNERKLRCLLVIICWGAVTEVVTECNFEWPSIDKIWEKYELVAVVSAFNPGATGVYWKFKHLSLKDLFKIFQEFYLLSDFDFLKLYSIFQK